ncbi:MAG TPA: hypothetical protein DEB06_10860, partial [Phycisphaerales bacterium]|nr:hypothetical protein [Phycisphaerales bacterium]
MGKSSGQATQKVRSRSGGSGAAERGRGTDLIGRRLLWIVGVFVWVFVALSVLTFDPRDSPGHGVAPLNGPGETGNWMGLAGAFVGYHTLVMLGSGAWLLILAAGGWLAQRAWSGPVEQLSLRIVGVVMLSLAWSGFHALLMPGWSAFPEGAGGLVAIAGVEALSVRFGAIGAALWLTLLGVIGLVVSMDDLIVALPRMLLLRAGGAARHRAAGLAERVREANAQRALVRENDVDDDAALERTRGQMKPPPTARAARSAVEADEEEDEPIEGVAAPEDSEEEADESDAEYEEEDSDAEEDADPIAFDPEALREKIAKLPVRFAGSAKRSANEEDLDEIRARNMNEEADRAYVFPGLDLLEDPEASYSSEMDVYVREQAGALEAALNTYGISGGVVGIDSGPVITLYQVRLAPGTKVSTISAVSSDIARALRAVNIRIVPNTEGLDTVGVEVPNRKKEKVRLKELMTVSDATGKMRLPLFLGKDASGNPLIVDLAAMPHMLIAGTTGSGKSVCMNAIIMGFLYTQKPSDLKLVLVDPKMVELSQFKNIPHLMCPVVTDMGKAAAILEWAVGKMDERYELLSEAGCRDIASYNGLSWEELKERFGPQSEQEEARIPRKLPFMVFVIDELADLMMTNKEVESSIVRIAQKARAVGIHLILATQRPQANVVTGLIKSNMPARLSFKVASGMDSRIVLDMKGGELLLGQGDMLMVTPRSSTPVRAQGTLVDDSEIRRVTRFIREVSEPSYERQLVALRDGGGALPEDHEQRMLESAQEDPLFDRAVEIVLETKRGSVSLLQRRLAIGYTRASRLIELMGIAGIIGVHKGSVAREVQISIEEWEAMKAQARADVEAAAEAPGGRKKGADPSQAALFKEPVLAKEIVPAARVDEPVEEPPFDVPADTAELHANTVVEEEAVEEEEAEDEEEAVEDEEDALEGDAGEPEDEADEEEEEEE